MTAERWRWALLLLGLAAAVGSSLPDLVRRSGPRWPPNGAWPPTTGPRGRPCRSGWACTPFAGGWTLASAEAVCDPGELGLDALEGLTSLVDQSLVRRSESGLEESRFTMLETIREFGREQLEAGGDLDQALRRHGDHFLGPA
jgi:hypothetical protein